METLAAVAACIFLILQMMLILDIGILTSVVLCAIDAFFFFFPGVGVEMGHFFLC